MRFSAVPPTFTVPFSPRIVIDPSRFFGNVSIVTSMVPIAPFRNLSTATPVSSLSMRRASVAVFALTLATGPTSHWIMST